ncbi:MAG: hypothetical protein IT371_11790 [Deltaproteobacteria bacterium]|nr:hypothetical protein [Deltaproteobacteria bacterium]
MRAVFWAWGIVVLCGLATGCADNASRAEDTQKTCTDGDDNDKDGLVDCDDHDCKTLEQCKGLTGGQTCGNGVVEGDELCDTKIPEGQPGACPGKCDDGQGCTADSLKEGGTCKAACAHEVIAKCQGGDGCCPKGCDAASDSDCSGACGNGAVELPELCDTKIPAGQPGACPTKCDDGQACTADELLGGGTCDASCRATVIVECGSGDGCCPTGCEAKTDGDCSASCGNGVVEAPETCDTQIAAGQPGACPTSCDDGNACTQDSLLNGGTCGATCSAPTITQCKGGDGCCPTGCTKLSDGDCSATCGNGTVEPPEKCDTKIAIGQPGACPIGCSDGNACTQDSLLNGGTCGAVCSFAAISQCKAGDGCCPAGCNALSDSDCSASCGNGVVEAPEKCDTQIAPGKAGACPVGCGDGNACTQDVLLNGGTCAATCVFNAITQCKAGDGCCPTGCNANSDSDCSPSCGNGVVEASERCDTKIAIGQPGACPIGCSDGNVCTQDVLLNGGTCAASCAFNAITQCRAGDGCCPTGCNANTDSDCAPRCGNGVLEAQEACDTAIPTGQTGACPVGCSDGSVCTADALLNPGTCLARCSFTVITQCQAGDGCCPPGCNAATDGDCSAVCGNGVLEPSERCDTQIGAGQTGACPTSCNDQNACTLDALLNPGTCQAQCSATAITQCTSGDGCCPSGCYRNTDSDCASCAPQTHNCNGQCVSDCQVATCGTACSPCSAPLYATPTCNCLGCDFTCGPGREKCPSSPTQCRLAAGDGSDGDFNTSNYPDTGANDGALPPGITRSGRSFVVNTDAAPRYGTYNFGTITISLGDELIVPTEQTGLSRPPQRTRPLVLRATGGLTVTGQIRVSGGDYLYQEGWSSARSGVGGPAGGSGGDNLVNCCQGANGGGLGGGGGANSLAASTAGCVCGAGCGGSFGTVGGSADFGTSGCRAGATYSHLDAQGSLRGGSGGGGYGLGSCASPSGQYNGAGGGGGALRIVTAGSVYLASGAIEARGGYFGGSGGAIEIVTRGQLINNGRVDATGAPGMAGSPSTCPAVGQQFLRGGDGVIALYAAGGRSGNGTYAPTPITSDGLPSGCE